MVQILEVVLVAEKPVVEWPEFVEEVAAVEAAKMRHLDRLMTGGLAWNQAVVAVYGRAVATSRGWI